MTRTTAIGWHEITVVFRWWQRLLPWWKHIVVVHECKNVLLAVVSVLVSISIYGFCFNASAQKMFLNLVCSIYDKWTLKTLWPHCKCVTWQISELPCLKFIVLLLPDLHKTVVPSKVKVWIFRERRCMVKWVQGSSNLFYM